MNTEDRLKLLENRVWNQDIIVSQLTQMVRTLMPVSQMHQAHCSVGELFAQLILDKDVPQEALDAAIRWRSNIYNEGHMDTVEDLASHAPSFAARENGCGQGIV